MRISDWSSDVCSSDLGGNEGSIDRNIGWWLDRVHPDDHLSLKAASKNAFERREAEWTANFRLKTSRGRYIPVLLRRSEEHTSELQSLMRISYAVFCLKKKTAYRRKPQHHVCAHQSLIRINYADYCLSHIIPITTPNNKL